MVFQRRTYRYQFHNLLINPMFKLLFLLYYYILETFSCEIVSGSAEVFSHIIKRGSYLSSRSNFSCALPCIFFVEIRVAGLEYLFIFQNHPT